MNYTNTKIKDFISLIIKYNNIDEIISSCKTQSEKGYIFERLFDIIIKFGFCPLFKNNTVNHLIGNSNTGKLKLLTHYDEYLNGLTYSGKSSGCSDITLQMKDDETYIFISSKYPKSSEEIKKQKSIDYYDIHKIIAMIDDNKTIYKKYKMNMNHENLMLRKQNPQMKISSQLKVQKILNYIQLRLHLIVTIIK